MNLDTILRLLDAGFTRSEILQMQGGADPAPPAAEQPAETPAEQPAETPAEQPAEAPAEQSAEAPAEDTAPTPADFAALRQELDTLRATLHNINVMHSGVGNSPPKDIATEIAEQWSADPAPYKK